MLKNLWNSKYQGLLIGGPLTLILLAFMFWRACYAPVWAAKPAYIKADVIQWEVCGASEEQLALLDEAARAVPACRVAFTGVSSCPNSDAKQSHLRFVIRFGGDPTRGMPESEARASTRSFYNPLEIKGYYRTRDRGDGEAGDVPVGEIQGADIVFRQGEVTLPVIGHEVMGHGCGYWHAYQSMNSAVYMNRHLLSPEAGTKGMDTRGMTLSQQEHMPELAGFDHTQFKLE